MDIGRVDLIRVPYDTGRRGWRMGAGPERLTEVLRAGSLKGPEPGGIRVRSVATAAEPPTETAVAFDVASRVSEAVRAARAGGRFPLVLAGNCMSALGTVAGLGAEGAGVVWLDAHGDLNTPETTVSGFLDGMAVAVLTGRCWRRLAQRVPGFVPVPDRRVVLVGVRQLDEGEEHLLAGSGISLVGTREARAGGPRQVLEPLLGRMRDDVDGVYLHLDLDVLDPSVGRANAFAAPDGLGVDEVVAAVEAAARRTGILGAALTAYDPSVDEGGEVAGAADRIVGALLDAVG